MSTRQWWFLSMLPIYSGAPYHNKWKIDHYQVWSWCKIFLLSCRCTCFVTSCENTTLLYHIVWKRCWMQKAWNMRRLFTLWKNKLLDSTLRTSLQSWDISQHKLFCAAQWSRSRQQTTLETGTRKATCFRNQKYLMAEGEEEKLTYSVNRLI